jgi:hypothetical protein
MRLPMATRRVIAGADAARTARVPPEQVGRDTGLVNEDVLARIPEREPVLPAPARGRDISAPLLVGVYRFF